LSDPSRSLRPGQSFLGLLVVLLVLTLLTAFAATRVDLTRYRSDAMARRATLVFVSAARSARQQRRPVLVRVDSARKRLGTVRDLNGNGRHDPSEPAIWTALDAGTDILDPPVPLFDVTASRAVVAFQPKGGATHDFVLYLTSDAGTPTAWRAVQVNRSGGVVQLWRFDGSRWTRGRA
jgi:Tfp pilus assembly protein FimT